MTATLGQMLRWHRSLCGWCTRQRACREYLDIAAEFTEARQIHAGTIAPHIRLDIREGTAT